MQRVEHQLSPSRAPRHRLLPLGTPPPDPSPHHTDYLLPLGTCICLTFPICSDLFHHTSIHDACFCWYRPCVLQIDRIGWQHDNRHHSDQLRTVDCTNVSCAGRQFDQWNSSNQHVLGDDETLVRFPSVPSLPHWQAVCFTSSTLQLVSH
jgi:hypothetical protein